MSVSNDIIILDLFRKGRHDKAIRLLMSTHQERLYSHVRRMVGTHDDADEILQRTFIKAWKGLSGFKEESRLGTWLFRIASNECSSFLEKRNRTRMSILDERTAIPSPSPHPSPAEIEARLAQAMETLPNKQKAVFVMRYFDEMSYAEMAEVTGTSIGALKSSYHLAVKKIEVFLTSDQTF